MDSHAGNPVLLTKASTEMIRQGVPRGCATATRGRRTGAPACYRSRSAPSPSAACAAARRAMGTRNGEQLT